jgi:hypothetical protein
LSRFEKKNSDLPRERPPDEVLLDRQKVPESRLTIERWREISGPSARNGARLDAKRSDNPSSMPRRRCERLRGDILANTWLLKRVRRLSMVLLNGIRSDARKGGPVQVVIRDGESRGRVAGGRMRMNSRRESGLIIERGYGESIKVTLAVHEKVVYWLISASRYVYLWEGSVKVW